MTDRKYRIAAIPGDGIGKEVTPEGLRVLAAAASRFGFSLTVDHFDFACANYYEAHGCMMPDDWKQSLEPYDAILFGAVGWPEKVADHISLWGSLVQFRRQFDQYVSLRPVRLMPGVRSPLVDPGDIDFVIVRENTEGEYSQVGGRMFEGTARETVIQQTVMTRIGVDRILRFAFELSMTRKKKLTSATKSNGIAITMPYWDERFRSMSQHFPEVTIEQFHIDALTAEIVLRPSQFDVIVGSNLFGDILSDLGPACTGTIGIAPSGNINPEKHFPSLFEPVHGSAPDISGKGIANPVGAVWSAQMLLQHIGEKEAANAVLKAIESSLAHPHTRTRDLGGSASTKQVGEAIAKGIG